MKIENLRISNFRGIKEVTMSSLGGIVIIAGQNGSGKSCLYDGIRLLKSVYGGYQQDEWRQWMGEFQIKLTNQTSDFAAMFNDRFREIRISCDFKFSTEERSYILTNAQELLRETVWRILLPEAYEWGGFRMAAFAAQFREREPEVLKRVQEELPALTKELAQDTIRGEFFIPVGSVPQLIPSNTLSIVFSTYRPHQIGVIDYHGAQRHYGRESVQGINLNIDEVEKKIRQSALYNYGAKYNNVKSEMAASYLREMLAEKAGVSQSEQATLTNTLKELFVSFFPDKEFLGPQPTVTGGLSFPVKTASGSTHDLDELSAGEKEILYGYLRIRNSAPRHSIVLLDEPELHLNPRLIRGLPQFYHKNLGHALGNQIWLVSHSDALLREVVGRNDYSVFHMVPCDQVSPGENQLKPLVLTADLELALIDLVGDLAAYRPGGKVILFEGGGDSDFDQSVTSKLFPKLQESANLISGSNKIRVRALHEILSQAYERGQLPYKFFAICDRDSDVASQPAVNFYSWDVYHVENYLLEPEFIVRVLSALDIKNVPTAEMVGDELRECARETLPQMLRHDLSEFANHALLKCIDLGTDPRLEDVASELSKAVSRSIDKILKAQEAAISQDNLVQEVGRRLEKYETSLADGTWVSIFRGRDILRRFVGKHANRVSYEVFRNLLVSRMAEDGFQPKGMRDVIDGILAA
jgi:predicted ATPase